MGTRVLSGSPCCPLTDQGLLEHLRPPPGETYPVTGTGCPLPEKSPNAILWQRL
jgi:hypothetical protein